MTRQTLARGSLYETTHCVTHVDVENCVILLREDVLSSRFHLRSNHYLLRTVSRKNFLISWAKWGKVVYHLYMTPRILQTPHNRDNGQVKCLALSSVKYFQYYTRSFRERKSPDSIIGRLKIHKLQKLIQESINRWRFFSLYCSGLNIRWPQNRMIDGSTFFAKKKDGKMRMTVCRE